MILLSLPHVPYIYSLKCPKVIRKCNFNGWQKGQRSKKKLSIIRRIVCLHVKGVTVHCMYSGHSTIGNVVIWSERWWVTRVPQISFSMWFCKYFWLTIFIIVLLSLPSSDMFIRRKSWSSQRTDSANYRWPYSCRKFFLEKIAKN